jgi:hypothetical protein
MRSVEDGQCAVNVEIMLYLFSPTYHTACAVNVETFTRSNQHSVNSHVSINFKLANAMHTQLLRRPSRAHRRPSPGPPARHVSRIPRRHRLMQYMYMRTCTCVHACMHACSLTHMSTSHSHVTVHVTHPQGCNLSLTHPQQDL